MRITIEAFGAKWVLQFHRWWMWKWKLDRPEETRRHLGYLTITRLKLAVVLEQANDFVRRRWQPWEGIAGTDHTDFAPVGKVEPLPADPAMEKFIAAAIMKAQAHETTYAKDHENAGQGIANFQLPLVGEDNMVARIDIHGGQA